MQDRTPSAAVDLSNCDREPIHQLGRVQSFGCLIILSRDFVVLSASLNVDECFGLPHNKIVGASADDIFDHDAIHAIRQRLQMLRGPDSIERMFGVRLRPGGGRFDVAVHFSGHYPDRFRAA
jgi:light-regulated signal transduction histidine kinase (bacteriophytochrome)